MSANQKFPRKKFVDLDETLVVELRRRRTMRQMVSLQDRAKVSQVQKMWHEIQAKCVNFKSGKCTLGYKVCRPCTDYEEEL